MVRPIFASHVRFTAADRLKLDITFYARDYPNAERGASVGECARLRYRHHGLATFWKGVIPASFFVRAPLQFSLFGLAREGCRTEWPLLGWTVGGALAAVVPIIERRIWRSDSPWRFDARDLIRGIVAFGSFGFLQSHNPYAENMGLPGFFSTAAASWMAKIFAGYSAQIVGPNAKYLWYWRPHHITTPSTFLLLLFYDRMSRFLLMPAQD